MINFEEMCRRIVLAIRDGVWVVDLEGRTLFNNERMADILGIDVGALSCQSCFECIFPEDLTEAQRHFAEGLAGDRRPFDFRLRRGDGSSIWVSVSCGPVADPSGVIVGLLGLFSEITERKNSEAQIRESEQRFRNMANSAPVLIWMANTEKLCEFFNQGWLSFTGRTLEQEIGNGWVQGVHPDDIQYCLDVYHSAFDARRPFEMEYRLRRHDGQYQWVLDTGTPRFASNGAFLGYVGTAIDITDKRQAEESKRQIAHLQLLATMGELTAAISHELRQPLAAISFNMDAAEKQLDSGTLDRSELVEILGDIRADVRRADGVIRRIRDLVCKRKIRMEPLDLNLIVADTLQLLGGEALRRRIEVRADLCAGAPMVLADRTQLEQVLINLMMNGMDAMANSGMRRLTVRTNSDGSDEVQVTVTDSGHGIAPVHLPRLFDSFFTTKREGMGLGLFLARSIVESHHGRIWADSHSCGGAVFHFTVPLNRPDAAAGFAP